MISVARVVLLNIVSEMNLVVCYEMSDFKRQLFPCDIFVELVVYF